MKCKEIMTKDPVCCLPDDEVQKAAKLIKDVMTTGAVSCQPDDDLQKALEAMEKNQVRRIPVVDTNQKIVGIIAQADVATRLGEPESTAAVVEEISKSQAAGT